MQLDVTWGIFTSPIAVAISTAFISWFIHTREKKKEEKDARKEAEKAEARAKMAKLLEDKEKLKAEAEQRKEASLNEWRQRYESNVSTIKASLKSIEGTLPTKVSYDDCEKKSKEKWDRINKVADQVGLARGGRQ